MKKEVSILLICSLFTIMVSGCDNTDANVPSIVFGEDGWNAEKINYMNPSPTLKDVATEGTYVDYTNQSYENRAEILGLLEEYAMGNNLTGLILCGNGGYAKYSDRIQFPTNALKDAEGNDLVVAGTKRYDYVIGYGFGVLSEGSLTGPLTKVEDGSATNNEFPMYYHTFVERDPKTLNYMNNKGEVVRDYIDYVAGSYFSTKLSESKQSYEWYPSLATEANRLADGSVRPLPLNVAKDGTKSINTAADRNTLASSYRIYVKTGADAVYNHASDKSELAAFAGRQVALEDYLTPHKQLHNQANGLARANDNLSGADSLKGMSEYYAATATATTQEAIEEAWNNSNVGVVPGTDSTGSYIDFTFNVPCTPFYAMYYLSSGLYAPIPQEFLNTIGGIANWGCFVEGGAGTYKYTPVDTTLSTGPYVVEMWEADSEFVFKENEFMSDAINGGAHRYTIDGIYVNVMSSLASDSLAAFKAWQNGQIDGCGIPIDLVINQINTKGTQQTRSTGTTRLNLNTCDEATWEYLFGENGIITQTPKDKYWELEPAMSNKDFIKGLNLSINRKEFAEKRGVTPSISYFGDAYLSNPEDGFSYNLTEAHQNVLVSYYGSEKLVANYGYDKELAIRYFHQAAEHLLAEGAYKDGDVITIEMCWQTQSQAQKNGLALEKYMEETFNDENVCKGLSGTITLDIQNTFTEVWSDIYYKKMMCGQFDIGFGTISGGTLNVLNFMEVLKSDNSSGFTLNWGVDTNSTDQLITYKGKQYTYDALWQAAAVGTVVDASGKNANLYDAVLVSNLLNEDGTRSIVINYEFADIKDVCKIDVYGVELWWYDSPSKNGYEYKSYEFVDNGQGQLVLTIDAETASTWIGEVSIDILIEKNIGNHQNLKSYISLETLFN